MAKRRRKPGESGTKLGHAALKQGPASRTRHLPPAALLLGVVLLVVIAGLYVLRPEVPWLLQLLLGVVFVGLIVLVYVLATVEVETPEELMYRLKRGQSADFGKRLRAAAQKRRHVRLPVVGEVPMRVLGGVLVGLLAAGWWLSPLAPVRIRKLTVEDITFRLTDEIKAAILVKADEDVALLQPPIVPARVRELVARITDESDPYQWALKATAESRFDEARDLLAKAAGEKGAEAERIELARAVNAMYAARFSEAARSYQELLNRRPDDTDLLCQAAIARMQGGEFDQAEPLIGRAAGVCRENLSADDQAWAPVLHARAMLLLVRGDDLGEAHRAAGRSREIWSETLGSDHRFVSASRNNQAAIHLVQAKYSAAHELYNWARESWAENLGPNHPYAAASLGNLAQLEIAAGNYDAARSLLQKAVAIRDTALAELTLPANHPTLALGYIARARLAVRMADYETAERMALQALRIAEETLGSAHPLVGAAADTLGALYTAQARLTRAEPSHLRALAIYEKCFGAEHPAVAGTLAGLARVYLAEQLVPGKELHPKTEEILGRVRAIVEESYGEEHPRMAAVLMLHGRLELARDRLREARAPLEEALAILTESFGERHPDVARTLGYLAALNHSPSPAVYLRGVGEYENAIDMAEQLFSNDHPEVAQLWYGLAKLHVAAGRLPEAQAALKRALEIQRKTLTPFHPELAATYSTYARVLAEGHPPAPQAAEDLRSRAQEVLALYEQENRPE